MKKITIYFDLDKGRVEVQPDFDDPKLLEFVLIQSLAIQAIGRIKEGEKKGDVYLHMSQTLDQAIKDFDK